MDIDTSSYQKPAALPVQKSLLDNINQFQQTESNNLNINQQKLNQANQALGYMTRAMGSLGPDATKEQYLAVGQNAVKMGLVPPNMLSAYTDRLAAAPDAKSFYNEFTTAAATHQETLNYHLGQPGMMQNGQTATPIAQSQKPGFGGIQARGLPIQLQNAPGTETVDTNPTNPDGTPNSAYGSKRLLGPAGSQIPAGTTPAGTGIPGQYVPQGQGLPVANGQPPQQPRPMLPVGKGNLSNDGKVTGVDVQNVPNSNQMPGSSSGPATSLPPGVGEAATQAGAASGTQLASERTKAASFQRDIFPLAQAIPALEKLGTKGTGPGTETINQLKSFVLSNIPGIKDTDFGFGSVKDFDKAKKYLTDFVNQNGNSGTNDKLAAAFAGNPSVGISNAAAVDVAKSALALRRMQQSRYLAFEDSGLPADQASKFFANGQINLPDKTTIAVGQLDPRAFGIDNMSDKSKKVLLDELNKNPREKELFDKSLQLAKAHGYLAVK